MGRPVNRPRRIRRLAQLVGVGALCVLATGATAILLTVGRAEVDMSTLVTAPYSPDPTQGPLLVAPAAPAPMPTRTLNAKPPRVTSSGGDRSPAAILAARRRPGAGVPGPAAAHKPSAANPDRPNRTLITPDHGGPAATTDRPTIAKPGTAKPTATKPGTTKPPVSTPTATKPTVTKPTATKPAGSKPGSARPGTPPKAKPPVNKPSVSKPAVRPEAAPGVLGLVPGSNGRDVEPPEPDSEPTLPELTAVPQR